MNESSAILVIGSLNVDLVQPVPRLPLHGETLRAGDLKMYGGGKGANQACAAARLGGRTRMAGLVGNDLLASVVTQELAASGVDTQSVLRVEEATGTAAIFVLPDGDNCIILSAGANGRMTAAFASDAAGQLREGDFLLLQLEVPMQAVEAAAIAAKARGATVLLDPAPAASLSNELLRAIDIFTPNQTEAAIILENRHHPPQTAEEGIAAAQALSTRGPRTVVIKMGALGGAFATRDRTFFHPAKKVSAVDSTAAGDTFNGALAVALLESCDWQEAVAFASAAATLSVTKPGAIASMPTRSELDRYLAGA